MHFMNDVHKKVIPLLHLLLIFILIGISQGEEQKTIDISQIVLEMEHNIPIKYDNVTICGNDTTIDGFHTESNIEITNSIIAVGLTFDQINFSSPISFCGSKFIKNILIEDSNFNREANFANTSFHNGFSIYNTSFLGGDTDFVNSRFFKFINIDNANFFGDVKFANSNFNEASFNKISFSNQVVDFSNANFAGDFSISDATFKGEALFENACLKGDLDISSADFYLMPVFLNTTFRSVVSFDTVKFLDGCNFNGAVFNDKFNLDSVKVSGLILNFDESHFNDESDFSMIEIDSIASFKNTWFNKSANFEGAHFNKKAEFISAHFRDDASFSEAQFSDYLNLRKSDFHKNLNFNDVIIKGDMLCEKIDPCRGSFQEGQPGRLFMNGTNYNQIFINWEDINQGFLTFDNNAYLLLIDNFKKFGNIKDANDCYYEYKQYNSRNLGGLYYLADLFYRISCGYGVRPERTFIWMLIIISLLSFYFWINDNMKPSSALVFSITTFISGTGRLLIEKPKYSPKKHLMASQIIFTLGRILGGILIILLYFSLEKWVTI
jgi:hypothetical protein